MAEAKSFNLRNPAVKRILKEVEEMRKDPSKEYISMPIEEDLFEWQFAIHGPPDTEFEGGIYHGRIILPSEYPFKPPAFMLLTPSGRFEVQTKICLSISQHHPEHWQPSWSVRTALVALIAFLPTKADGAIGSLEYTCEERRGLAIKSRLSPPKFGNAERQKVINMIHERMLANAPPVPELKSKPDTATEKAPENKPDSESVQNSAMSERQKMVDAIQNRKSAEEKVENENVSEPNPLVCSEAEISAVEDSSAEGLPTVSSSDGFGTVVNARVQDEQRPSSQLRQRVVRGKESQSQSQDQSRSDDSSPTTSSPAVKKVNSLEDRVLSFIIVIISFAIFVLICKKIVNV